MSQIREKMGTLSAEQERSFRQLAEWQAAKIKRHHELLNMPISDEFMIMINNIQLDDSHSLPPLPQVPPFSHHHVSDANDTPDGQTVVTPVVLTGVVDRGTSHEDNGATTNPNTNPPS